jgi:hypothetical protein
MRVRGFHSVATLHENATLPLSSRPERSVVEGPAIRQLFLGNVFLAAC